MSDGKNGKKLRSHAKKRLWRRGDLILLFLLGVCSGLVISITALILTH